MWKIVVVMTVVKELPFACQIRWLMPVTQLFGRAGELKLEANVSNVARSVKNNNKK